MEAAAKITAVCLAGCVLAAVLKKGAPELQLPLALAVAAAVLLALCGAAGEAGEALRLLTAGAGLDAAYLAPVLKCAAIAVVTRVGGDLCRDSGEAALASLIDISGSLCAAVVAVPLLRMVLETLSGLS